MAEAKQKDEWNHTATLIAWMVRLQVGKKAQKVQPKHFHPFSNGEPRRKTVMPKSMAYERLHAMVGVRGHG